MGAAYDKQRRPVPITPWAGSWAQQQSERSGAIHTCEKCRCVLAQVSLTTPTRWRCVNARCDLYDRMVERNA